MAGPDEGGESNDFLYRLKERILAELRLPTQTAAMQVAGATEKPTTAMKLEVEAVTEVANKRPDRFEGPQTTLAGKELGFKGIANSARPILRPNTTIKAPPPAKNQYLKSDG